MLTVLARMDDTQVFLLFLSDYNNASYEIVFMTSVGDSHAFIFQYKAVLIHLEQWFTTGGSWPISGPQHVSRVGHRFGFNQ